MDSIQFFKLAFGSLFSAYGWLLLVFFLIAFLRSSWVKDLYGALQVKLSARLFLDQQNYTLFKNVIVPIDTGNLRIDQIIVSPFGVFVIEIRDMKGWILGSAQQIYWTQVANRQSNPFRNPLHRSYQLSQALQSALELDPATVFPLIVFIGDNDFKTPMPDNVINAGGYLNFIKSKKQPVLGKNETGSVCARIRSGRLKPLPTTERNPLRQLKTMIDETNRPANGNRCPQCGKLMVLKTVISETGQSKQFRLCSEFPICRTFKEL